MKDKWELIDEENYGDLKVRFYDTNDEDTYAAILEQGDQKITLKGKQLQKTIDFLEEGRS